MRLQVCLFDDVLSWIICLLSEISILTLSSQSGDGSNGCNTAQYSAVGENGLYKLVGDGVTDTPAHFTYTLAHECAFTTCCLDANGDSTLNTCPGQPGRDPVKNFMNYLSSECSLKHGEFTPGQAARMVAQYETFRSPSRTLNCGCPKSCTAAVLATTAFDYGGASYTCKDDILDAIKDLGNEFFGCESTGSIWSNCAACNPRTCAAPAPDATTSKPLTWAPTKSPRPARASARRSPLSVSNCARKVRNRCQCAGTRPCKNKVITYRCRPPLYRSSRQRYRTNVIAQVNSLCRKL